MSFWHSSLCEVTSTNASQLSYCSICINLEVTCFAYLPQSHLADGLSCISQFPEPEGHHTKWHDTCSFSKIFLTTEVLNQGQKEALSNHKLVRYMLASYLIHLYDYFMYSPCSYWATCLGSQWIKVIEKFCHDIQVMMKHLIKIPHSGCKISRHETGYPIRFIQSNFI